MILVLRDTSPLWRAQKLASNVHLVATPALVKAFVHYALLAPSTRHQGLLLCRNATNARWGRTVVQAPWSARNVLKAVTRTLLGLQVAVCVRLALPAPSKVRFRPVSVTPARQPSTQVSLAPLIVMLAPMVSLPLLAFPSALHCVQSVPGLQLGWIFPTTAAHSALLALQLCKLGPSLAQRARLDYFQMGLVKNAHLAISELSVVSLEPVSALHAAMARSALCWAPQNAPPVRPALTPNLVKASVPCAVQEHFPTNLAPVYARHAPWAIFLWQVLLHALSAHLARLWMNLEPSSAGRALKEHTPPSKARHRASSVPLVLSILQLVPRRQRIAKFVLKEPSTP